jgi:predicted MFS family arabinose efflux permease
VPREPSFAPENRVSASDSITPPVNTSRASPFHGWRTVAVAFTAQLLTFSVTFSAFGVFVVPLSEAFGTTQGRLGYGLSIAFLVTGAVGPFIGRWMDRGLARTLMLWGAAVAGLGLLALSRATALWQLAIGFCGIVSLGAALFGPTTSTALVASWFVRRRGLALGVTVAGATIAGMAAPPVAALLIETVGWRGALAAFGAGTLGIGLPVFATVVSRPEDVGQTPDGDPPGDVLSEAEAVENEVGTGELIRDPNLWLVAVGFGLVFTSPIVMMLVLVPFAEDLGYTRISATYFFSAMGPFSLLGKVVFGVLADRIPPRLAVWLVALLNIAVWALLYGDPGYGLLLGIGALYGLGIGATAPLHGVIIGLCFGRAAFGRAIGIGSLAALPLIAGAPAISGYLYDATGTYHTIFVVQGGLLLLGAGILSFLRIPEAPG